MIQKLTNIQTAFSLMRWICIGSILSSLIISSCSLFLSFQYAEKQREKIYVLDQGKSLILALSQDVNSNRAAEIKSHVRRFHELFFSFAPNKSSIDYNISQALNLADRSALSKYQELEESGFYTSMINANASQDLKVDSIVTNYDIYPYKARVYGKIGLVRRTGRLIKSLITECDIRQVPRSEENPHGLLIEKWNIIESITLKELER